LKNIKTTAVGIGLLTLLPGCNSGHDRGIQVFQVDDDTIVWVAVHGVVARSPYASEMRPPDIQASPPAGGVSSTTPTPASEEKRHRMLLSPDGQILFAYDLAVLARQGGGHQLRLIPATRAPTFREVRQVEIGAGEMAAVDILENRRTGEKIFDDFRFVPRKGIAQWPGISSIFGSSGRAPGAH
jgi:hypothetical protein